jgi:predicted ferric reductase
MCHIPVYEWTLEGIMMKKLLTNDVAFGFVGLVAMDVLLLFSVGFWRRRFYNAFLFSHVLGIIFLLIGVALHMPGTIPWLLAGLGIYGLDLLIRVLKTRICTAILRPIPELGMTRVEVPHLNAGWRPGQHVRLRVLSTALGTFGWTEIHPFTIASASGDGLTLMVKKAGDWSNKLYNMATESDAIYAGGGGGATKGTVWIEGPYGGVGNTVMESYSGAVFVMGGSGITFALSSIADLVQKDLRGSSRLKVLHLIWCVQDARTYPHHFFNFNWEDLS